MMESRGTPTTAIQHPIAFASADTAREHLTRLASKRFSREKRKVLEALPPHYCGAWGTWQRYDGRPCYVLSPYDVPPGHPGRSAWYGKFAEGHLDQMPHLIYDRHSPDRDLVFSLVSKVDLWLDEDDAELNQAGRPAELPPVVEVHEQMFSASASDAAAAAAAAAVPVGSRVKVKWALDNKFYEATVMEYEGTLCRVLYESGEHSWMRLSGEGYEILDDDDDGFVSSLGGASEPPIGGDDDDDGGDDDDSSYESIPDRRRDKGRKRKRKRERERLEGGSATPDLVQSASSVRSGGSSTASSSPGSSLPDDQELVPPDSESVRELLSIGYKRWRGPVKLRADGSYRKGPGRPPFGFEFDPKLGLLAPSKASPAASAVSTQAPATKTKNRASPPKDESVQSKPSKVRKIQSLTASAPNVEAKAPAAKTMYRANLPKDGGLQPTASKVREVRSPTASTVNAQIQAKKTQSRASLPGDGDMQPKPSKIRKVKSSTAGSSGAKAQQPPARKAAVSSGSASPGGSQQKPTKPRAVPGGGSRQLKSPSPLKKALKTPVFAFDESAMRVVGDFLAPVFRDEPVVQEPSAAAAGVPLADPRGRHAEQSGPPEDPAEGDRIVALRRPMLPAVPVGSKQLTQEEVLAILPESYLKRFGALGVDSFNVSVVIVSPFDEHYPKTRREAWLMEFNDWRASWPPALERELPLCVQRFAPTSPGQCKIEYDQIAQEEFTPWEQVPPEIKAALRLINYDSVEGLVVPKQAVNGEDDLIPQVTLSSDVASAADAGVPLPDSVLSSQQSISERVMSIRSELGGPLDSAFAERYVLLLRELDSMYVSTELLKQSQISCTVRELKTLQLKNVDAARKPLLKKWRKQYKQDAERKLEGSVASWRAVLSAGDGSIGARDRVERHVSALVKGLSEHFEGILKEEQAKRWRLMDLIVRTDDFFRPIGPIKSKDYRRLHQIVWNAFQVPSTSADP